MGVEHFNCDECNEIVSDADTYYECENPQCAQSAQLCTSCGSGTDHERIWVCRSCGHGCPKATAEHQSCACVCRGQPKFHEDPEQSNEAKCLGSLRCACRGEKDMHTTKAECKCSCACQSCGCECPCSERRLEVLCLRCSNGGLEVDPEVFQVFLLKKAGFESEADAFAEFRNTHVDCFRRPPYRFRTGPKAQVEVVECREAPLPDEEMC